MIAMNITFLLVSILIALAMANALRLRYFRLRYSAFVGGLLSGAIWVLIFGVLRGLFF